MDRLKHFFYIIFILLLGINLVNAQQTVGVLEIDSSVTDGYVLFYPSAYSDTYLIDNCGRLINAWAGTGLPGLSAYLLEDGRLLRTERVTNDFNSGGSGGRILIMDWDGVIQWKYTYATDTTHQHHDVAYLSNGNVLLIAWEKKTMEEAIAMGRNPDDVSSNGMWPDHIMELEPVGSTGANIVWEWHVWDHLIQDFDPEKMNYGVVGDHPELIDLNFNDGSIGVDPDFNHSNAIAYNEDLDQIILNVRNFDEFWIIDHSTTTAEAAGHTGGNSGKGGDLLYRWGNPAAYDRADEVEQQLFGQHDAYWIPEGMPDAGKVIVFNNGVGRPGMDYSSIDIIDPPLDSNNNYPIEDGQPFGPLESVVAYVNSPPTDFFSSRTSSGQQLENGHILVCGSDGEIFEADENSNKIWRYKIPVNSQGPVAQGMNSNNRSFRARRYAPNYPGLEGKDLTPGARIELNPFPLPNLCEATTSIENEGSNTAAYSLSPNPAHHSFYINNPSNQLLKIKITSITGQLILEQERQNSFVRFKTADWNRGVYLVSIYEVENKKYWTRRVVLN